MQKRYRIGRFYLSFSILQKTKAVAKECRFHGKKPFPQVLPGNTSMQIMNLVQVEQIKNIIRIYYNSFQKIYVPCFDIGIASFRIKKHI